MLRSLTVAGEPRPLMEQTFLTVSVVICAYTEDRWPLLLRSVSSVQCQSRKPAEIIVCIDHNASLLERCRQQWAKQAGATSVPVVVLANRYQGHLGSARNSAAEVAHGDVVAFLDDDAWADPDWLDQLLLPYEDDHVVAVGGAPTAEFERARPGLVSVRIRLGVRMRIFRASRDAGPARSTHRSQHVGAATGPR